MSQDSSNITSTQEIVSVTYQLNALSAKPKDFEPVGGQRLSRIIFKQGASNPGKNESMYCVLPEVSESLVHSFMRTAAGKSAVVELIEGLQDAAVRAVWLSFGRSACDADLTVDALCKLADAQNESVRLTKENIQKAFKDEWSGRIALALAIERDVNAASIFAGEDVDVDAAAAYWNSEAGAKFLAVASNYEQFFVLGAERKPAFPSAAIKAKVLAAIGYCDDSTLKGKLEEKLTATPVVTIDDSGL